MRNIWKIVCNLITIEIVSVAKYQVKLLKCVNEKKNTVKVKLYEAVRQVIEVL